VFRSEAQRARACRALCARARMPWMWTDAGPTEQAIEIVEKNGGPLSSGERIMVLTAWAFWNGDGGATVADVVERLDGPNLRAIGGLMIALGGGGAAVDQWLVAIETELAREVRR
jgi:hypothetical protein